MSTPGPWHVCGLGFAKRPLVPAGVGKFPAARLRPAGSRGERAQCTDTAVMALAPLLRACLAKATR